MRHHARSHTRSRSTALLAAAAMSLTALAVQPAQQPAQPTPDGNALQIPSAHRSMGEVYHVISDRDRQIFFESDAPLEKIKGQSNDVIGYAVMSESTQGQVVAGQWNLPVESMKTGIKLRDEHLAGKDWFNAESYPYIIVQLREFQDRRETKSTSAFTTYTGTVVADLTMHGVTRTVTIPESTVTVMPESDATRSVARGDLVALRSAFSVELGDYEVSHPVVGQKVANEVSIDVSLFLSSEPPARQ